MGKTRAKLTPKQEKFVDAYIETGNGSEAVRQAGYDATPGAVRVIASTNLTKDNVISEIERRKQDIADKIQREAVTALAVLLELLQHSDSDRIRADIARDLMDRAGYRPPERREITGAGGSAIQMESRVTQEIAQRARELLASKDV